MTMTTEPFPRADRTDQLEQRIPVNDIDDTDTSTSLPSPVETDPTDYYEQHQVVELPMDDRESIQPSSPGHVYSRAAVDGCAVDVRVPWKPNMLAHNKLLLVTNIYPAGHQIRIEDYGTDESPDMQQPGATALDIGEHVLFVYTMTADDADTTNSTVTVRIYGGTEHHHLGEQIYNGRLTLTKPELAIGDALDPPAAMLRVPLRRHGLIPLQIFTRRTVENISGPNEINILLPQQFIKTTPSRHRS